MARLPTDTATRIVIATVTAGTLIRIPQLFHSLAEPYGFRQAQTAMVADVYASDGIDLLVTPLPIFGSSSDVPMEFPLFQGIASLGISAGLDSDVASRMLGLISFQVVAALLFVAVRRWHGSLPAAIAVVLFEVLPFGLFWGAASLIDFFSVALALAMVLALSRWFDGGPWWTLAVGGVSGVLAFLVKVTTAPLYCLLLLAAALLVIGAAGWRRSWRRLLAGMAAGPGAGLIAAIAWTAYSDAIKIAKPQTAFLTSTALREWNFGSLAQRLDAHTWLRIGLRVLGEIALPAGLLLVLGVATVVLVRSRTRRIATAGWMATAAAGPLIFTNLYYIHSYYLIAVYPAVVAIMAIGAEAAWMWLRRLRWRPAVLTAAAIGMVAAAVVVPGARRDVEGFATDSPIPVASRVIIDATPEGSRIVAIGCGWDPSLFYLAGRRGAMLGSWPADEFWASEPIGLYSYLYSCDVAFDPGLSLPAGTRAVPTSSVGLYELEAARAAAGVP